MFPISVCSFPSCLGPGVVLCIVCSMELPRRVYSLARLSVCLSCGLRALNLCIIPFSALGLGCGGDDVGGAAPLSLPQVVC